MTFDKRQIKILLIFVNFLENMNFNFMINEKLGKKPLNFLLHSFFSEKALLLNGIVFIFVYPNDDSIIAMRVEIYGMKKIYKSQHLSNVTELKTIIPYYK